MRIADVKRMHLKKRRLTEIAIAFTIIVEFLYLVGLTNWHQTVIGMLGGIQATLIGVWAEVSRG